MKQTYAWKMGMSIPVKPDVAGTIFEKIIKERGELKPSFVVEEAKPVKSPLHPCFEWDDKKAALEWREHQARQLIRYHVVLIHPDTLPKSSVPIEINARNTTRTFVSVREPDGKKKYLHVETVMSDAVLKDQYIKRAYKEIQDWSVRYESIAEFAGVRAEIKKIKLD